MSALTLGLAQGFLTNHSFEIGTDPGAAMVLSPGNAALEGWSVVGGDISYVGTRWKAAHGVRSIGLPCGGGISQTFKTDPGESFEVRFSMAGDPTVGPAVKSVAVSFGDIRRPFTFDTTGHSFDAMGWDSRSWIFKASEDTTTVVFQSPTAECSTAAVDNVRITPGDTAVGIFQEQVAPSALRGYGDTSAPVRATALTQQAFATVHVSAEEWCSWPLCSPRTQGDRR